MILLLFIIGVLAIIAIARYNEDDRLFWKLFGAFTIAFTATSIAVATIDGGQDETNLTNEVYPTQAPDTMLGYYNPFTAICDEATVSEEIPVPVSKDNTLIEREIISFVEVCGNVRDQPPSSNPTLTRGPTLKAFTIDSS